jgi:hypothetical protein
MHRVDLGPHSRRMRGCRGSGLCALLALGLLLAACGMAVPSRGPRPPLPPRVDPFPVTVEAAVERIEAELGHSCFFSPESGPIGEWGCGAEGRPLTLVGGETGALWAVDAAVVDDTQTPEIIDRVAAVEFRTVLAALGVPEDVLPSEVEMTEAVRDNWPLEMGDGWILGFDRTAYLRSLYVRYAEPER